MVRLGRAHAAGTTATRRETMSKSQRHANYRRKLAHVIVLGDGTKMVTLRDAANVLLEVFGSVNARSGAFSMVTDWVAHCRDTTHGTSSCIPTDIKTQ